MNTVELALRLKHLRTERGLTLEQVASKAGLTRGWLSKVENFRVTPSLPALSSIAEALGVTMSELFSGLDNRPPIVVVRRDERRDGVASDYRYAALAHKRPSRRMDPFVLSVPPSAERPMLAHDGEEFLFVLSGSVTVEYANGSYELASGDSAYFEGANPHRILNGSGATAELLVVFDGLTAVGTEFNGEP